MTTHLPVRRYALPGYTLIELLIAAGIFVVVTTIALAAYVNVFGANARAEAERLLTDETGYLMERIVKDLRNSVIDYPEYRRWATRTALDLPYPPTPNASSGTENETRNDYLTYLAQTPAAGAGLQAILGTEDFADEAGVAVSPGLFLLSPDGTTRMRIRWVERVADDGTEEGELRMTRERLVCYYTGTDVAPTTTSCDAFGEEQNWRWIDADADTTVCTGTVLRANPDAPVCRPVDQILNTEQLNVRLFRFALSPERDPFFAYEDASVQVQPMVYLLLDTATSADAPRGAGNSPPEMHLNTAVSVRTYSSAVWTPTVLPD